VIFSLLREDWGRSKANEEGRLSRKLRYFILTDEEHFYHVFKRFLKFFLSNVLHLYPSYAACAMSFEPLEHERPARKTRSVAVQTVLGQLVDCLDAVRVWSMPCCSQ